MLLNSKDILEQGLVKTENSHGKPAQVGYDLSLKEVKKVGVPFNYGIVLKEKTTLAATVPVEVKKCKVIGTEEHRIGWLLAAGYYEFTFHEGCKLSPNHTGFICQRSSLLRNGSLIRSSIFDPGFETDNIGTFCLVNEPIFIEQDARVAQMYFFENSTVSADQLYSGQWQGDKQRKS